MTEREAIEATTDPATARSLATDLRALGVRPGMTLIVHASLSSLGYVVGGAQAVVTSLLTVLGDGGTLVMPSHSADLSDPATWSDPPAPESWWPTIRAEMPAFDPALTPTRSMGAIVDCFRHLPGVIRSDHPTVSATAVGPNAAFVVTGHELAHGLGETSPQARVHELDGHILLLGVTHANNTSLHLAEHRAAPPGAPTTTFHSPVNIGAERRWVAYESLVDDDGDFEQIGEAFATTGLETTSVVGAGSGRLMRSRDLVDFAADWMRVNRSQSAAG